ncbi:MAG TPA: orotate phosphoribosyltransferase [Salinimicrobium sp.]|nr:orotate phosphoribosyltransferase [Salinimicrobium sp.]
MILDTETAKETAGLLLQIKAIKLEPQQPFTWASGWKSPIYCDNRILLSYPEARKIICHNLCAQLLKLHGEPDAIAGVATGAIGIGMLVANYLDLPFVYVRPEAKGHGRKNKIEGKIEIGKKVVVIEDLISTGNSSLKAAEALREEGVEILGMMAIFSYGFEVADENFRNQKIELHTLSNYSNLIDLAKETGYVNSEEMETLQQWSKDPGNWKK